VSNTCLICLLPMPSRAARQGSRGARPARFNRYKPCSTAGFQLRPTLGGPPVKKLLIAAAALALAPAGAIAADISGVWKVHGVFSGVITYTAVCTFTQAGPSLAGP